MLAAIEHGATFLEFDVQVTRDGVCVLYHDNYVVIGDQANPESHLIADMKLDEFKGASPVNSTIGGGSDLEGASDDEVMSSYFPVLGSSATNSGDIFVTGTSPDSSRSSPFNSLSTPKLLRQQKNGVIASASDKSLQAWTALEDEEFPTLLKVFEHMPAHIAFDIEIKMSTPDHLVKTSEEELIRMVDTILRTVDVAETRAEGQGRPPRSLLFSSFDPDVCALVKQRRPTDWVMFLSTGGTSFHADPRRMSVDAAIEVAALNGLQGVILDSGSLFHDQDAVKRARVEGLMLMTYGAENDDVVWVGVQKTLGVHGVIVDDVKKMKMAFLDR